METRLERAFKELASREELLDKSTRRWREMSHNSTKWQDKKSESWKEIEEKNKLNDDGNWEQNWFAYSKNPPYCIFFLFSYHGG
jgi:hypothetical protein